MWLLSGGDLVNPVKLKCSHIFCEPCVSDHDKSVHIIEWDTCKLSFFATAHVCVCVLLDWCAQLEVISLNLLTKSKPWMNRYWTEAGKESAIYTNRIEEGLGLVWEVDVVVLWPNKEMLQCSYYSIEELSLSDGLWIDHFQFSISIFKYVSGR